MLRQVAATHPQLAGAPQPTDRHAEGHELTTDSTVTGPWKLLVCARQTPVTPGEASLFTATHGLLEIPVRVSRPSLSQAISGLTGAPHTFWT